MIAEASWPVLYPEIDQLIVKLAPLTIGTGTPLFGHDAKFDPRTWKLTDHRIMDSGALFLTYSRTAGGSAAA